MISIGGKCGSFKHLYIFADSYLEQTLLTPLVSQLPKHSLSSCLDHSALDNSTSTPSFNSRSTLKYFWDHFSWFASWWSQDISTWETRDLSGGLQSSLKLLSLILLCSCRWQSNITLGKRREPNGLKSSFSCSNIKLKKMEVKNWLEDPSPSLESTHIPKT